MGGGGGGGSKTIRVMQKGLKKIWHLVNVKQNTCQLTSKNIPEKEIEKQKKLGKERNIPTSNGPFSIPAFFVSRS